MMIKRYLVLLSFAIGGLICAPTAAFAQEDEVDEVDRFLLWFTILPLITSTGSGTTAGVVSTSSKNEYIQVRREQFKRFVQKNPQQAEQIFRTGVGHGIQDLATLLSMTHRQGVALSKHLRSRRRVYVGYLDHNQLDALFDALVRWQNRRRR